MVTNLELFKHVMYYMFKKDNMPELNLLELGIMWKALAKEWDIYIPEEKWDDFLTKLDNEVYNNYINFTSIFNNYFYN